MKQFSVRENLIIKIIGRKRMTLDEIAYELFNTPGSVPFDSYIAVANSVTRIIKKCSYLNLPWILKKTRENRKLTIKRIKIEK